MAKKEVKTDLWVAGQLDEYGIKFDAQGSNNTELDEALKTASKRGTGKVAILSTSLLLVILYWLLKIRQIRISISS